MGRYFPYSGKVLQVQDGLNLSRADAIFSFFTPIHYGTFWGVITRILYMFVGLAPLVLLITGAKMFKICQWDKVKQKEVKKLSIAAQD
jgi:uncharacterized iron-regulated membrane protein